MYTCILTITELYKTALILTILIGFSNLTKSISQLAKWTEIFVLEK